jgi:hypothetical protein
MTTGRPFSPLSCSSLVALEISVVLQAVGDLSLLDYVRASAATIVGGVDAGFIVGSRIGRAPSVRMTELAFTGHRVGLVPLLVDAAGRGVLRQAGTVWQFRHGELQEWLAARHRAEHKLARTSAASRTDISIRPSQRRIGPPLVAVLGSLLTVAGPSPS